MKWDGYRLGGHIEPQRVRLITRGAYEWNNRYPVIAAEQEPEEMR
ncbi:hypothetical protein [Sinorhizobium alkalisoli]